MAGLVRIPRPCELPSPCQMNGGQVFIAPCAVQGGAGWAGPRRHRRDEVRRGVAGGRRRLAAARWRGAAHRCRGRHFSVGQRLRSSLGREPGLATLAVGPAALAGHIVVAGVEDTLALRAMLLMMNARHRQRGLALPHDQRVCGRVSSCGGGNAVFLVAGTEDAVVAAAVAAAFGRGAGVGRHQAAPQLEEGGGTVRIINPRAQQLKRAFLRRAAHRQRQG